MNHLVKKEALDMISGNDIEIGRLSAGWDADTDFDALPTRLADITAEDVESAELFQGDLGEFEEPLNAFPTFRNALRFYQAREPRTRAVRIDTDKSYEDFGVDKAVKELARRTEDLRNVVEAHLSVEHGGPASKMRAWDEILGAADSIADLKNSSDAKDAIAKMPQVPLTVPDEAKDAVKCWQDGENVVVSLRFALPNGEPRVATLGSRPRVNEEEIVEWAENEGFDPVTILGAVPVISSVATGKRLVREAANAALEARCREDVCGMDLDDEPIVLIGLGKNTAPLAALMHLMQKARTDAQARKELDLMYQIAATPEGQKIAAPVLAEAQRRLSAG